MQRTRTLWVERRECVRTREAPAWVWLRLSERDGSGVLGHLLDLIDEAAVLDAAFAREICGLLAGMQVASVENARKTSHSIAEREEVRELLLEFAARDLGIPAALATGRWCAPALEGSAADVARILAGALIEHGAPGRGLPPKCLDRLGALGLLHTARTEACLARLRATAVPESSPEALVRDLWLGMLAGELAHRAGELLPEAYLRALTEIPWWEPSWPSAGRPKLLAGAEEAFWSLVLERELGSELWLHVAHCGASLELPSSLATRLLERAADDPYALDAAVRLGFGTSSAIQVAEGTNLARVASLGLAINGLGEDPARAELCNELTALLRVLPPSFGAGPHAHTPLGISILSRAGHREPGFLEFLQTVVADFWGYSTDTHTEAARALVRMGVDPGKCQRPR